MYIYEYMETQSPVHDFNEREPSKKFIKFSTIYCRKNCNQKHITAFSSCIISWITLHDGNLNKFLVHNFRVIGCHFHQFTAAITHKTLSLQCSQCINHNKESCSSRNRGLSYHSESFIQSDCFSIQIRIFNNCLTHLCKIHPVFQVSQEKQQFWSRHQLLSVVGLLVRYAQK